MKRKQNRGCSVNRDVKQLNLLKKIKTITTAVRMLLHKCTGSKELEKLQRFFLPVHHSHLSLNEPSSKIYSGLNSRGRCHQDFQPSAPPPPSALSLLIYSLTILYRSGKSRASRPLSIGRVIKE